MIERAMKVFLNRQNILLYFIIIIFLVLSLTSKSFLNFISLEGVLYYVFAYSLMTIGMTILFVSGGFDMGVGSVYGFTCVFAAVLIKSFNLPSALVVLIIIAAGIAIGAVIGFCIAKLNVNPFITTMASMFIFSALRIIIAKQKNIIGLPERFTKFGNITFLNLSIIIWIGIAATAIAIVLLRKNKFLRLTYLVGINEKAAMLMGIKVYKIKLISYVIISVLASVTALLNTSKYGTAIFTTGDDTALILIAAVVIGGCSLSGGRGTIYGSMLGLILITLLNHSISSLGYSGFWNKLALGFVMLVAIIIDSLREKRSL